jgi:phosphodiesterase/alkaline phosphatase D-like protein
VKAPGAVAGRLAWTTGWVLSLAALPAQPAPPFVSGVWCGNVTPAGATVCVRLGSPGLQVRLAVGAGGPFRPDQYSAPVTTTAAAGNVVRLDIGGLRPATAYAYGIEVNGVLREEPLARGTFRTFPEGPASFRLAFGSCGDWRAADHRAYEAVAAAEPLIFLHLGDLHYSDTATTAAEDYRHNYDAILRHPQQSVLFRAQAVAYVWDDHDFNGNDSDGSSPGRAAARSVYRDYVPHYPLTVPDGTIGQAFTVGRVRVILTDLRSAAHPATDAESARKTRLGAAQKAWFKRELLAARDAGCPLILWGSSVPWIHPAQVGDDSWGGYATERAELADFLRQNRIRTVVVLAGDMHALAYDDGTHSDYATGGGAPLVVLHASALNSAGSVKGGPYTAGPLPGPAHYGLLDITDSGGPTLAVRFLAQRVGEGARLAFAFTAGPAGLAPLGIPVQPAGEERAFVNVSTRARIHAPGEAVVVGFVVGGNAPRHVLARAIGPALGTFGITDALPRPHLRLLRDGVVLASNDQWARADARHLSGVFERTGAFPVPESSPDAALVFPLAPGAYTLEATGLGNGTGTVLLEAYGVP